MLDITELAKTGTLIINSSMQQLLASLKSIAYSIAARPLLLVAVGFIIGTLTGSGFSLTLIASLLACLILLPISFKYSIFAIFLGFFAGLGRIEAAKEKPANHIKNMQTGYQRFVGKIVTAPNLTLPTKEPIDDKDSSEYLEMKGHFTMTVDHIILDKKRIDTTGLAKIYFEDVQAILELDDIIYLTCVVYNPSRPKNPGQFDSAQRYNRRDIYWIGSLKDGKDLKIMKSPLTAQKIIFRFRNLLREKFYEYLDHDSAAFMSALILGFQDGISSETRTAFQKTGTAHLIAISGLHLVIVFNILWIILSILRIQDGRKSLAIILSLFVYSILTGFNSPVARSFVMLAIYLFADIILKRPDSLSSISLAAILMLLINPFDLFEISFQLSFLAVLSIIISYKVFYGLLKFENRNFLLEYTRGGIAISLCSFIFLLPPIADYFHIQPNISIIANLLMYPFVFLLMLCGFIFLIVCSVPFIPVFLALIINNIFSALEWLANILSSIPFSFSHVSVLPIHFIVLFYIALAIWLIFASVRQKPALLALLAIFPIATVNSNLLTNNNNSIAILDVGKGKAVYVNHEGKDILFDCGSTSLRNPASQIVIPFLIISGVKKIDYFVISSEHPEYTNSAEELILSFPIKEILVADGFKKRWLIDMAKAKGIRITFVENDIQINDIKLIKLSDSLSVKIKDKVILIGQVNEYNWRKLSLTEEILLFPACGELFDGWEEFTTNIVSKTVVISCNRYSSKIADELVKKGLKIHITDKDGAFILK